MLERHERVPDTRIRFEKFAHISSTKKVALEQDPRLASEDFTHHQEERSARDRQHFTSAGALDDDLGRYFDDCWPDADGRHHPDIPLSPSTSCRSDARNFVTVGNPQSQASNGLMEKQGALFHDKASRTVSYQFESLNDKANASKRN